MMTSSRVTHWAAFLFHLREKFQDMALMLLLELGACIPPLGDVTI